MIYDNIVKKLKDIPYELNQKLEGKADLEHNHEEYAKISETYNKSEIDEKIQDVKSSIKIATPSEDGLMSSSDKIKVDTIGELNTLQTSDKTSIVSAINENKNNITSVNNSISSTNNTVNSLSSKVNNSQVVKLTTDSGTCMGIPNGNLNDISTTGYFMGDSPANSPISGWVYVESKVHNNLYQVQDLTNLHDSSVRYTRHKTGGSWSAWRSL